MIPENSIAVGIIQNNEQINLKLVQLNSPLVVNGLEFAFQGMQGGGKYSGFQVSRDPANPFIWIASVLFVIGLIAVFYFPHREVWVLTQKNDKGSRLLIRPSGRFGFGKSSELANLIKEIENKLASARTDKQS